MRFKFSEDTRKQIVHRYRMGENIQKIASTYGINPSTIHSYINELGGVKNPNPKLHKVDVKLWDDAAERYKDGDKITFGDIAIELGVSRRTVTTHLKLRGCHPRKERYPSKFRKEVANAYRDSSKTSREIAEEFNVGVGSVLQFVKEHGFYTGHHRIPRRPPAPNSVLKARAIKILRESGMSLRDIGRVVSISGEAVRLRLLPQTTETKGVTDAPDAS